VDDIEHAGHPLFANGKAVFQVEYKLGLEVL
jgi:hypothetical protein